MLKVIASQGRVGDRTDKKLKGVDLLGRALKKEFGIKCKTVGKYSPIYQDNWSVALQQASETLLEVQNEIEDNFQNNKQTLLLSNACALNLGTIPIAVKYYPNIKLLWIDAHADFNTPMTTRSGFLSGMALSGVCGLWDSGYVPVIDSSRVLLIGARQFDDLELELVNKSKIRMLKTEGFSLDKIVEFIKDDFVWIHIDLDVLEPGFLYEDFPVKDGLFPEQLKELLNIIPESKILGVELAEFNAFENEEINQNGIELILDIITPLFKSSLGDLNK